MVFVLTSNPSDVKSVKYIGDDFYFCLLHDYRNPISTSRTRMYQFDIVHHQSVPVTDLYKSEGNMNFRFHPVDTFEEAVDVIGELIANQYKVQQARDEDVREELTVTVCCPFQWSQRMTRLITDYLTAAGADDVGCNNLFRTLMFPSMDRVIQMLQSTLNSKNISADDPATLAYAINLAWGGAF